MSGTVACILLFCVPAAVAAQPATKAIPIRVSGPWSVAVGPGSVTLHGQQVTVADEVTLEVPPAPVVAVRDEAHASLPVFNEHTGGWMKGARLAKLITQECSATGLLIPGSVRVKPEGGGAPFALGRDFQMDGFWATVGRIEAGAIGANQRVLIDYDYSPCRLDSVVADERGRLRLVVGEPAVGAMLPPAPPRGEIAVANIWVPGNTERLTEENLYPIEPEPRRGTQSVAEALLPHTLAKLRAGQDVKIVAWGDSVTAGGGVGAQTDLWYQNRFAALLRQRFPAAKITMLTAAWPGGNSNGYMSAPPGGAHDFVRDVLEPKPDVVTIEFVNDAYLNEEQTQAHYAEIMRRLSGIGAEVILITPHLVRPDWMGVQTLKFDDDPRPYVKGLRRFATENHIALADASARWCRLWREGIPYVTLEANSINHPDARGHEIFAQALIDLFPEK
jgi:lysophospholipase L1-like esterase